MAALEAPFHFGIATLDPEALKATIGPMLGLRWVDLPRPPITHHTPNGPVVPSSRVIWSAQGPMHVELIQSEEHTVYFPDRGTYLHHVGYWVSDLRASIAAAEEEGWKLEVTQLGDDGGPVAFAYMSRPGSVWVELVNVANKPGLHSTLGIA